jgi:hypothetical protein
MALLGLSDVGFLMGPPYGGLTLTLAVLSAAGFWAFDRTLLVRGDPKVMLAFEPAKSSQVSFNSASAEQLSAYGCRVTWVKG